jgi:hypothetical protein
MITEFVDDNPGLKRHDGIRSGSSEYAGDSYGTEQQKHHTD